MLEELQATRSNAATTATVILDKCLIIVCVPGRGASLIIYLPPILCFWSPAYRFSSKDFAL